ncbi:Hypothetical protein P9215_14741 [Prochlorococcus marinus str. MIT 9215]|uniref:Methyltransferase domain-containing protein n=1 Tax=Prochlorococcus marinus (strain MIT 9215) TaxID=93060 RepID=A8G656_PROM2|nr:methyltransferase domain-containing protein [Prochlorococcus marinus]ABV51087.1 Hypothetical protein P9215_14741 [Prochlorococcus marinus str. MIT 9215]
MKISFSKSLLDILSLKNGFLEKNDHHLKDALLINQKYNLQDLRKQCKNCQLTLKQNYFDFTNHGVNYKICEECGHLNGERDDSIEFTQWLYKDDGGSHYSENYLEDYESRVSNIYLPKAKFLKDSLMDCCGVKTFSLSDFGCGGGHFVHSLSTLGVKANGFDISDQLINLASKVWDNSNKFSVKPPFLRLSSEDDLIREIIRCESDVISFTGALEHLMNPNNALQAFVDSSSKYFFFSVPLFSLSTFIENVSSNTFPRHLSGGHTHLYTHESIDYFCNKYSFEKVSQWHFGTDAMDLRRSLIVETAKKGMSESAKELLEKKFLSPSITNEIQQVLDKHFGGSETHMLIKKR